MRLTVRADSIEWCEWRQEGPSAPPLAATVSCTHQPLTATVELIGQVVVDSAVVRVSVGGGRSVHSWSATQSAKCDSWRARRLSAIERQRRAMRGAYCFRLDGLPCCCPVLLMVVVGRVLLCASLPGATE